MAVVVTKSFAGSNISVFASGAITVIRVTLPSGAVLFNVNGWGDGQWDAEIRTRTDPADIQALASFKASWSQLQPEYLQEFKQAEDTPTVPPPAKTAGETVNDDRDPSPNRPPPLEVDASGRVKQPPRVEPTTADQPETGPAAVGTDKPTVSGSTTQSIGTQPQSPIPTQDRTPITTKSEGAFNKDDNPAATPQTTTVEINNGFNKDLKIVPQPNLLDNFANYTYTASVYLMSPSQYREFVKIKKKKINGYNLLFQSGGAANNVGGPKGALSAEARNSVDATGGSETAVGAPTVPGINDPDAGRNPFFTDDFYIDSVILENVFPGKQTRAAHMATTLKITVVEPNGITLLDRLYQAVQDNAPTDATGAINYTAAQYLLVMRWYGYDQNGNLVRPGATGPDGASDPNAIVEKYVPFVIKDIQWSVQSRLVTYEITGAPVGQLIGGTTARGTIPYDIELRESTVGGLLGGAATFAQVPPATPGASTTTGRGTAPTGAATGGTTSVTNSSPSPAKANNAPTPRQVLTGGLVDAMNKYQQELVDVKKVYELADTYEVVFAAGAEIIRDAKITLPGAVVNKSSTPMAAAPSKNAASKDPTRQAVDATAKKITITAGQQMLQVIDQAIRNSSFIYNQAAVQTAEKPLDAKAVVDSGNTEETTDNKVPVQTTLTWYQITMEAVPKGNQQDNKRNDYAYTIRYIISLYPVQNFNSKYYPIPKFRGIHKQYRYWFTGENIDVLDYTANFNTLYHMTVSGREPNDNQINRIRRKFQSSMRELNKFVYSSASDQTRQQAEGQANEIAANAAEALYSPSDLANCKMRIVGDPAWIQQGSVAYGVDPINFNYAPFLPDGTINFDAEQCLFAVEWQRPQDYDLNTGLADPYKNIPTDRKPINSYVYQATKCMSEFRQGRFEQTLEGTMYFLPTPNLTNAASQPQTTVGENGSVQRENFRQSELTAALGASTGTKSAVPALDNSQTAVQPVTLNLGSPAPLQTATIAPATSGIDAASVNPTTFLIPPKLPGAGQTTQTVGNPTSSTVPTNQIIAKDA